MLQIEFYLKKERAIPSERRKRRSNEGVKMRSNNLLFLQVHAFLFTKFQFSMISKNQMIKLALHIYFFIEFLGFDKLYFVSSQFFFWKNFDDQNHNSLKISNYSLSFEVNFHVLWF